MIDVKYFFEEVKKSGINFFTGVPDSLLKDICAYITSNTDERQHVIAANEGNAIGLAVGHYLATKSPALVYLQNSGLGNIINPLTSLADSAVYGIPMLIMIGWRGEISEEGIQINDEPQHIKQGQITCNQLEVLKIPYIIIDSNSNIENIVTKLVELSNATNNPVVLLVRKGAFNEYQLCEDSVSNSDLLTREDIISNLLRFIPNDIPVISTTGMTSRELFELRLKSKSGNFRDFLTVGGMGHASSIATGIALSMSANKILCLDGDGAFLMHMGSLAISARQKNLIHIVLNNGAHDSVGGQPTFASSMSLTDIAKGSMYDFIFQADNLLDIEKIMPELFNLKGSVFFEIKCKKGYRSNLSRPNKKPSENKLDFMSFLKKIKNGK